MMDKLGEPGQYTLFAPTDEAFDKLSPDYMERIMDDKDVIAGTLQDKTWKLRVDHSSVCLNNNLSLWPTFTALVNYHLINSVQCAEALMAGSMYDTAEGSTIEIGCDGDSLTVKGIKMVLTKDIVASNGVIHLIDQVLIPDSGKNTHVAVV